MKNLLIVLLLFMICTSAIGQKHRSHRSASNHTDKEKSTTKEHSNGGTANGASGSAPKSGAENSANQALRQKFEKQKNDDAQASAKTGNEEKKAPSTKLHDFGPGKSPRYVIVTENRKSDGATSVVYGNELDAKGRIAKPNGHGVVKDGKLVYSRGIKDSESNPRFDASKKKSDTGNQ